MSELYNANFFNSTLNKPMSVKKNRKRDLH